jgi:hypothetical protein
VTSKKTKNNQRGWLPPKATTKSSFHLVQLFIAYLPQLPPYRLIFSTKLPTTHYPLLTVPLPQNKTAHGPFFPRTSLRVCCLPPANCDSRRRRSSPASSSPGGGPKRGQTRRLRPTAILSGSGPLRPLPLPAAVQKGA